MKTEREILKAIVSLGNIVTRLKLSKKQRASVTSMIEALGWVVDSPNCSSTDTPFDLTVIFGEEGTPELN